MKIQKTSDGSDTLVSEEFGALYHSFHGSFQEAKHIFIDQGLSQIKKKEITIFEMGFGSGLNAILSYYFAKKNDLIISYVTIEAFPVSNEIIKQLNYNDLIKETDFDEKFEVFHSAKWNEEVKIDPFFSIKKIKGKLESYEFLKSEQNAFDIIFFDAFSPNDQESLWTESIFKKMYNILMKGGFLITYCAKGVVKRTLKSVTFNVVALPGPIGKREIVKAIKLS